jgi:hypothetical protein
MTLPGEIQDIAPLLLLPGIDRCQRQKICLFIRHSIFKPFQVQSSSQTLHDVLGARTLDDAGSKPASLFQVGGKRYTAERPLIAIFQWTAFFRFLPVAIASHWLMGLTAMCLVSGWD